MRHIELTEEEFYNTYLPADNHLSDSEAPFDGHMFETYGAEHSYILSHLEDEEKKRKIWTIIDGEEPYMLYYISGYHLVNRLGFFITKKPVPPGVEITVKIDTSVN